MKVCEREHTSGGVFQESGSRGRVRVSMELVIWVMERLVHGTRIGLVESGEPRSVKKLKQNI